MTQLVAMPEIAAAAQRLRGRVVRSSLHLFPAKHLRGLGFQLPAGLPQIWLKAESEQPVGSFKLRGATNKLLSLPEKERARGVITYSSGNHAQGVAHAARAIGIKAVIVMPENAPRIKRDATLALGAEIVTVGPESSERRRVAEELMAKHGYVMAPPYDDRDIVAGQATCGLEIVEQLPSCRMICAPVSGGGLLSGVAAAAKLTDPAIQVWGIEPELAGDAAQSFAEKRRIEWPADRTTRTVADGLRTQSLGELNFQHILRYCDGIFTVTEEEIREATRMLLVGTKIAVEPSGAVSLAGIVFHSGQLPPVSPVVCILSGGNIDPALREMLLTAEA